MKIFVMGGAGMLGQFLVPYFESLGYRVFAGDIDTNKPWVQPMDVRDYHGMHYSLSEFQPKVLINLAALTDLEYCEGHVGDAIDTNTVGAANCVALAAKFDIPYVYISTAGIFDGKQEQYDDYAQPNPLCIYAKSKYWGELISATYDKAIVLRCGWQMGSTVHDKKFIGKIMKQIKAGATELNVVTDKLGTPTYVKDFTLQIEKLLKEKAYGVWNVVCKGNASRYDVSVELIRLLDLHDTFKINVVNSKFWEKEYFAPRPDSEKLITKKLDEAGFNIMRHWKDCLKEYVVENPEFFSLKG